MQILRLSCNFLYCALLLLSTSALAGTGASEESTSNLDIVQQKRGAEILAAPGVDWSTYSGIRLERASVEFRKNWVRDQRNRQGNRISEKDQERIKSDLADLLNDVLTKELAGKGGYTLTGESGAGILRFAPSIEDLDVIAPDRVRDHIGYSLTDSQGRMTLKLQITDSVSGDILATTRHFEEDPQKGYLEWTTQGTNRTAARFMLLRWSNKLLNWLDKAREDSPTD